MIITLVPEIAGGSLFTYEYAKKIAKPCLHIFPDSQWRKKTQVFLEANPIQILNVAGPRCSNAVGVEQFVYEVLNEIVITVSS